VARRKKGSDNEAADDDEDLDDDDFDGDDDGNPTPSSPPAPSTTVARVAAAAAALADPDQAHMLFVKGTDAVRPGVLVLVNDADCELFRGGSKGTRVRSGDRVTFISTLHGG